VKRVLFLLAAVLGACVVWIALRHTAREARDAPVAPASLDGASSSALAAPDGARRVRAVDDTADASDVLVVRSREGFALKWIAVEHAGGSWSAEEVADGRVRRERLANVSRVCAPGHLPQTLEPGARELVLVADALVVIEGEHLDRCFEPIDEWNPADLSIESRITPTSWCAQLVDERHLAIAVSCDDEAPRGAPTVVDVSLPLSSGGDGVARIHALPGMRATLAWTCAGTSRRSELRLAIDRAEDAASEWLEIWLRPQNETADGPVRSFDWGTWKHLALAPFVERRFIGGDESRVRFDDVIEGIPLEILALDRDTHAWGRAAFVHDGSVQRVTLYPPVKISAVLRSSNANVDLSRACEVGWTQRFEETAEPVWATHHELVRVAADGALEVAGPTTILDHAERGDALPQLVDISITMPGFARWTRRFELDTRGRLDCGVVQLAPLPADVRALFDDADKRTYFVAGREIVLGLDDGTCQVALIDAARRTREGADLVLRGTSNRRDDASPTRTFGPDGVVRREPLAAERAVRLLTLTADSTVHGFMRTGSRAFLVQPSSTYSLSLRLDRRDARAFAAPAWHGIPVVWDIGVHLGLKRRERVEWRLPDEGMSVWWIREDDGPCTDCVPNPSRGGSIELALGTRSLWIPAYGGR
jgi:hypothetical protein